MQDHGLHSPLGCPKCEGTFCSKQSQQKHIPTCLGKKDKFGPKQTPHAEKKFRCDECPKNYTMEAALMQHKKVHKGTAKKYVCNLCGKALSSITALHRHEKIHEDNFKKKKKNPNSKVRTFGPDIYINYFFGVFFGHISCYFPLPPICLGNIGICLEYVGPSPKGEHMPWSYTLY